MSATGQTSVQFYECSIALTGHCSCALRAHCISSPSTSPVTACATPSSFMEKTSLHKEGHKPQPMQSSFTKNFIMPPKSKVVPFKVIYIMTTEWRFILHGGKQTAIQIAISLYQMNKAYKNNPENRYNYRSRVCFCRNSAQLHCFAAPIQSPHRFLYF